MEEIIKQTVTMERMMSQAPDLLSIPVNSRSAPPMFKVPVQMTEDAASWQTGELYPVSE
ncbi:MAG: hypothetical protein ACLVJO_06300 [[Clostridium] scindens]